MRKLFLFLALLALPAEAQVSSPCPGALTSDEAYGQEAITISSTALPFTATVYAPSGGPIVAYASVTLETNPIRVSVSGVVPTAAIGELFNNATGGNVKFFVCGQTNVRRFLAIRTGSDAAITVTYYKH